MLNNDFAKQQSNSPMKTDDETQFIEGLAKNYFSDHSGNKYIDEKKKIIISKYKNHIANDKQGKLLELGSSLGISTSKWVSLVGEVVCVEGVEEFIAYTKKTIAANNVSFIHGLFEDIDFNNEYDYVVADYILEHVESVDDILTRCYRALKPGGLLFSTVPNAQAFSRQMAVEMGLMKNIYDLTENDHRYGHRRTFDKEIFENDITKNGFELIESGGTFFKPFADFQLGKMVDSEIIGEAQLDGLGKMGRIYPRLCEGIYVVAMKK